MVDLPTLGRQLTGLAWVATKSFLGTLLLLTLAGFVLGGVSWAFLREHPWYVGLLAAFLAVVEGVGAGVILGGRRAVFQALGHGLRSLRLGESLVRLVFERLLGVRGEATPSEQAGHIARGLEKLPLAEAEQRLSSAVGALTGGEQAGWLRRRMQGRLLGLIRALTLARFRDENAAHGGVNLLRVKEELEGTVDGLLVERVQGSLRAWTLLVAVGLPLVVAAQTWLILTLLSPKP